MLIVLCLLNFGREVASISADFDVYPPLPISKGSYRNSRGGKKIDVATIGTSAASLFGACIKASALPVAAISVVGGSIFVGFRVAQKVMKALDEHHAPNTTNLQTSEPNAELKKLKAEQEELWSAILTIHDLQAEGNKHIQASNETVQELRSTVMELKEVVSSSVVGLTGRIDAMEKESKMLGASAEEEYRAMRQRLNALQTVAEEAREAVEHIRLKDLPYITEQHDQRISARLNKFKEDLKKIITSGASRGNSRSSSSSGSGETTGEAAAAKSPVTSKRKSRK